MTDRSGAKRSFCSLRYSGVIRHQEIGQDQHRYGYETVTPYRQTDDQVLDIGLLCRSINRYVTC